MKYILFLTIFISTHCLSQNLLSEIYTDDNAKMILTKKDNEYLVQKVNLEDSTIIDTVFNQQIPLVIDYIMNAKNISFISASNDFYAIRTFKLGVPITTRDLMFCVFYIPISNAYVDREKIYFLTDSIIIRKPYYQKDFIFYSIQENETMYIYNKADSLRTQKKTQTDFIKGFKFQEDK